MSEATFEQAIQETFLIAKRLGKVGYVYELNGEYWTTFTYRKDWLFRAYPGGRRELSRAGTELAKAERIF